MENQVNELIQAIILEELKKHPEGLTTKQIEKIVAKKLKKVKKMLDIWNSLWYNNSVIRKEEVIEMAMTPSKRHAMRAMYEARDKARKNARLGLNPKLSNKKKGKRK